MPSAQRARSSGQPSIWPTLAAFGATDATQGTIAAVVSTAIMVQALGLLALEVRARHRGTASILGPIAAPSTGRHPG